MAAFQQHKVENQPLAFSLKAIIPENIVLLLFLFLFFSFLTLGTQFPRVATYCEIKPVSVSLTRKQELKHDAFPGYTA